MCVYVCVCVCMRVGNLYILQLCMYILIDINTN